MLMCTNIRILCPLLRSSITTLHSGCPFQTRTCAILTVCTIWIDSRGQVDEGVSVESCGINLLLGDDLVPTFFEHSSQHAFERFVAACDQAEMKISSKKAEIICHSRNTKCSTLKACDNTPKPVEKFKYLGVVAYAPITEGRTRRLIHVLEKQMTFCVSFHAPWSQNGSFQMQQSCQFQIGPCSDPYRCSWILGIDWKHNPNRKRLRRHFKKRSRRDDSRQTAQLWNS